MAIKNSVTHQHDKHTNTLCSYASLIAAALTITLGACASDTDEGQEEMYKTSTDKVVPGTAALSVEVEGMELQGFKAQSSNVASGGAWVQTNSEGTATWAFDGPSNNYNVRVFYFDEEDGASTMSVAVDGENLESWTWDKKLGSNLANASTLTSRVVGSSHFCEGSTLTLSGVADGKEPLRVDRVVLEPCSGDACMGQDAPNPQPVETINPPTMVGFGKDVTGGRGGKVYPITSTSSKASVKGSVPWALAQGDLDEPRVLLLMVEGGIFLSNELKIRNSNLTIDGSFAPGAGTWFEGDRVEFLGSNILVQHTSFLGNDPTPDSNSDSVKVGNFRTGPDVKGIYFRHCAFMNGRDEVLAFTSRRNGETKGPRVLDTTIESSIIANAVGDANNVHKFGLIVGDGTERITVVGNLFTNLMARSPFVKEHAKQVEFINNVVYNSKENQSESSSSSVHLIGNNYRRGPIAKNSSIRPIRFKDNGSFAYLDDNIISNKESGDRLFHGAGKIRRDPIFSASSTPILPSDQVLDYVLEYSGPKHRGEDATQRFVSPMLANVRNSTGLSQYPSYPGALPKLQGARALSPDQHIPKAYQDLYPQDTSLDQTIESGSWKGRQVWERVSAWQTQ